MMKSIEYLKTQLQCDLNYCVQHNKKGEWCYLTVEDYKYLIELIEKDGLKGCKRRNEQETKKETKYI